MESLCSPQWSGWKGDFWWWQSRSFRRRSVWYPGGWNPRYVLPFPRLIPFLDLKDPLVGILQGAFGNLHSWLRWELKHSRTRNSSLMIVCNRQNPALPLPWGPSCLYELVWEATQLSVLGRVKGLQTWKVSCLSHPVGVSGIGSWGGGCYIRLRTGDWLPVVLPCTSLILSADSGSSG